MTEAPTEHRPEPRSDSRYEARGETRSSSRGETRSRSDFGPPPGYTPMVLPGESISKYRNLPAASSRSRCSGRGTGDGERAGGKRRGCAGRRFHCTRRSAARRRKWFSPRPRKWSNRLSSISRATVHAPALPKSSQRRSRQWQAHDLDDRSHPTRSPDRSDVQNNPAQEEAGVACSGRGSAASRAHRSYGIRDDRDRVRRHRGRRLASGLPSRRRNLLPDSRNTVRLPKLLKDARWSTRRWKTTRWNSIPCPRTSRR